eukprot:580656_1
MATSISPATLFKMIILCIVLIIIPQIDAQTNYYGSYFVCNQASECKTHTISCTEGQDCDVTCSGEYSCQSNQIICSGDCGVTCSHYMSCRSATITTSSQVNNVRCSGYQSCESARITCSDGSDCHVDCVGEKGCNAATIDGPTNGNLTVSCHSQNSCSSVRINCPINGVCYLDATAASTTTPSNSLVIDAADMISGIFTVYSARSGTIKCPA